MQAPGDQPQPTPRQPRPTHQQPPQQPIQQPIQHMPVTGPTPQAMQMQIQQPFAQPGPPQVSQMQGVAHSPHHGQHGQQPQQQMHQMPQQMHQMPQQMQHPRVPPPAQMVQQQMPMGSPSLMGSLCPPRVNELGVERKNPLKCAACGPAA